MLTRLGPDPLRRDFDPDRAWESLQKRPRRAIGDALLDQRVIAGAGNIYRNEALFLTGIHPLRPSGRVTPEEWVQKETSDVSTQGGVGAIVLVVVYVATVLRGSRSQRARRAAPQRTSA